MHRDVLSVSSVVSTFYFYYFINGRNVMNGKRVKIISPFIHKMSDFLSVELKNPIWDSE